MGGPKISIWGQTTAALVVRSGESLPMSDDQPGPTSTEQFPVLSSSARRNCPRRRSRRETGRASIFSANASRRPCYSVISIIYSLSRNCGPQNPIRAGNLADRLLGAALL
jgi:hypothetical protein